MRLFLWLAGVGCLSGVGWWLYRRLTTADDRRPVSARWLRQQAQLGDRVEFHGPSFHKVNKVIDDIGWYNRRKYRKGV